MTHHVRRGHFFKRLDFLFSFMGRTEMWGVLHRHEQLLSDKDAAADVEILRERHKDNDVVRACVLATLGDKPRSIHDVLLAYRSCASNKLNS
jgi:hypothetical protein